MFFQSQSWLLKTLVYQYNIHGRLHNVFWYIFKGKVYNYRRTTSPYCVGILSLKKGKIASVF